MNSFKESIHCELFHKYGIIDNQLNQLLITNIIFNDKTHFVSTFKEWLIYGDNNEFLKRYYNIEESSEKIKLFCQFYETNSVIFPNYFVLPESKFLFINIKQKQKVIDEIEGKATDSTSLFNLSNNQLNDNNEFNQKESNKSFSHSQIFNERIMKSLFSVSVSNNSSLSYLSINKLINKIDNTDSVPLSTSLTNNDEIQTDINSNNKQENTCKKEIILTSQSKVKKYKEAITEIRSIFKHNSRFIQNIGNSNIKIKEINTARKITNNLLTINPLSQRQKDKQNQTTNTKKGKFINKLNIKEIKKLSKDLKTISPKFKHITHHNTNLLSDRYVFNSHKKTFQNQNVNYTQRKNKLSSKTKTSASPKTKHKLPNQKIPLLNIQTTSLYQKDFKKPIKFQNTNTISNPNKPNVNQSSKIKNKISITSQSLTINKRLTNQNQIKTYRSKPKYNIYYSNKLNKKLTNLNINFSLGNNSNSFHNSKGQSLSPFHTNNSINNENKINNSSLRNSFLKHSTNNNIQTMLSKYTSRTYNHTKINLRLSKTTQYSKFKAANLGKVDFNRQHQQQPKSFRKINAPNEPNINTFSLQASQIKGGTSFQSSFINKGNLNNKTFGEHNRQIKSDIHQQKIKQNKICNINSQRYSSSNRATLKKIYKKISPQSKDIHKKNFVNEFLYIHSSEKKKNNGVSENARKIEKQCFIKNYNFKKK